MYLPVRAKKERREPHETIDCQTSPDRRPGPERVLSNSSKGIYSYSQCPCCTTHTANRGKALWGSRDNLLNVNGGLLWDESRGPKVGNRGTARVSAQFLKGKKSQQRRYSGEASGRIA